ncbi:helical backbone metal receptor [Thermus filiformis]|uniref:ABC transporter substrate-binding protein n=1 Tax=Thermus filiformis TaxID=276 RepID=A0A0D6XCI5_THEFI|nr:helical backbone metal receptor [Thermus filiformis]KIX84583.1 ABC transporter substrate-binding protein [Thermus filiformis]
MRLVSLTASNTEILWALGALDWLVGVDDHSDFPEEVRRLPKVGPDLNVDLDKVEALRPDLVLASLSVPGMEKVVEGLQRRRIPHLVLDPESLEDVFQDILTVAEALGLPHRGRQAVGAMRYTMAQARRGLPRFARPPRVLVEWWPKPVIAAGKRSWVTGMLAFLGAENALKDPVRSRPLREEELEELAPEVWVLSWCGARRTRLEVALRRPLRAPALEAGRVYAIPEAYLGRPGPRLAEGVRRLADVLILAGV